MIGWVLLVLMVFALIVVLAVLLAGLHELVRGR